MVSLRRQHALLPLIFTLAACGSPQADASTPVTNPGTGTAEVRLEPVAANLEQPTSVVSADDGSGRLFVTQKTGLLRIVEGDSVLDTPFLDLTDTVSTSSEQGLLGVAFHPDYAQNGRFFINYTRQDGATVIAEYAVSSDPNVADASSAKVLLTINQPYSNHNGGDLVFGPDGYLYIGTGDGGAGGDPQGNGQDKTALLGKMLRLDVDNAGDGEPYGIPASNPFVNSADARPEVWAYGLRNPWRFSFDRQTGDLWIADVGQNAFEEVDYQPASSNGGEDYGWNVMEADSCYNDAAPTSPLETCDEQGLVKPVLEYPHSEGQSITGGYVYRGEAVPALEGRYVYGDFVSGTIWSAAAQGDGSYQSTPLLNSGFNVVAFGEDEAGELYVADYSGTLYRFAPATETSAQNNAENKAAATARAGN